MMSLYTSTMNDHFKLKKFVEETYCVEYNPNRIRPQLHKNTPYHKYFVYKPMKSSWGESEFYYDVRTNTFLRVGYENHKTEWDTLYDDTFS